MCLNLLNKVLLATLASCALAGCVTSASPILGDAKAILGDRIELHSFAAPALGTREHASGIFEWRGSRYVYVPKPGEDYSDFTVHPFEGRDLIVQSTAALGGRHTEYSVARRIANGVYLVMPIAEEDADEGTRERFCTKTQNALCSITTPEQLFVFARATAAKDEDTAGIIVVQPAPKK